MFIIYFLKILVLSSFFSEEPFSSESLETLNPSSTSKGLQSWTLIKQYHNGFKQRQSKCQIQQFICHLTLVYITRTTNNLVHSPQTSLGIRNSFNKPPLILLGTIIKLTGNYHRI